MKENVKEQLELLLRPAAVTLFAIAAVAARTVHASPPNPVVVPPTDLPAFARQTGDAMLLDGTADDRILPYIEQNQRARLATFDVAGPLHIKGEGSVNLDAPGPFDLVSPVGNQAEPVRFRHGKEDALLDLPRLGVPKLIAAQGLTSPGSMTYALTVTHPTMHASPDLDFWAIDPVLTYELNRMFDVKYVRAKMTMTDRGTTFMLTKDGS